MWLELGNEWLNELNLELKRSLLNFMGINWRNDQKCKQQYTLSAFCERHCFWMKSHWIHGGWLEIIQQIFSTLEKTTGKKKHLAVANMVLSFLHGDECAIPMGCPVYVFCVCVCRTLQKSIVWLVGLLERNSPLVNYTINLPRYACVSEIQRNSLFFSCACRGQCNPSMLAQVYCSFRF